MRNRNQSYQGVDDRNEGRERHGGEGRNMDWQRSERGGDWQSRERGRDERYGQPDDDEDRARYEGQWRAGGERGYQGRDMGGERDRGRTDIERGQYGNDERYGRQYYGQPEQMGGTWEDEYQSRRGQQWQGGGGYGSNRGDIGRGYGMRGGNYGGGGYGDERGGNYDTQRGGYRMQGGGMGRGEAGYLGGDSWHGGGSWRTGDNWRSGSMAGREGEGMRGQESFRGRGPKGFTRSDERIKECVCDELEDAHDIDASDIEVTVRNGEVTLSGHVDSRHVKRLAEDIVYSVRGVKECNNQLRTSGSQFSQQQKSGQQQDSASASNGNGNVRRTEITR